MKKDKWVRPWDFASKKGVSLQTVYRWIRERKIPMEEIRKVKIEKECYELLLKS